MMMTDSTGSIVWQGEFKPFGETLSVSGSITNNLRFPGQYTENNPVNWIDPEGKEVSLCQRAKQGLPIRLGPVHHSYVNVNGTIYGFHPENNKAFDKGKVEIEKPGKDIKCGRPLKCVDDSCVLHKDKYDLS